MEAMSIITYYIIKYKYCLEKKLLEFCAGDFSYLKDIYLLFVVRGFICIFPNDLSTRFVGVITVSRCSYLMSPFFCNNFSSVWLVCC